VITPRPLVAFSRPHTIVGTVLSVVGLYVMAEAWSEQPGTQPGVLTLALVGALATNVYIVGVNQLTDVAIDRVNKPRLPLAAGTLTMTQGRGLVAGSAVTALVAGLVGGPYLLAALVLGLVIGSAYSLPPLRLKRFHLAAAAAITVVRALVVNLLLFAHFHRVLTGAAAFPRHVLALTGVVLGLSIVIAWFKDIPDAAGDARHGIRTLTLRLGPRRVVTLGLLLLSACYAAVIVASLTGLQGVHPLVLALTHLVFLAAIWTAAARVDLQAHASIVRFYLFIWALFFAEYAAFTAAAALA
jgi:homogentisate phytyltransferase/homogentisate geranylgeranyltransferase